MPQDDIFSDAFDTLLKEYLIETQSAEKLLYRDRVVAHCLPYVQKIARGIARRSNDPVDDLIQVGSVGLIKALEKYNPLAGSSFKTYATYLITGEIRHYLRDKASIIKAPRQVYELYYRINLIVHRLADELGRTPTDVEIADELECPVDKVQFVNSVDRRRTTLSLDNVMGNAEQGGNETQFIERFVDDKYHEFLQNQEDKLVLERVLNRLKPDLRSVVKMTFYEDMSQSEIAKELGISQMQVSRRLRKALDMLHDLLKSEQPV